MNLRLAQLGDYKKAIGNKYHLKFNCPNCDDTNYHLCVHTLKGVFICYRCGFKGKVSQISPNLHTYKDRVDKFLHQPKKVKTVIKLPDEAKLVTKDTGLPWRYLHRRGITEAELKKYSIYYASDGFFGERIIFPVFMRGKLSYFVSRTYTNRIPKYLNSPAPKQGVIFKTFEGPVKHAVIVEGIFDAIQVGKIMPAIAILGKLLSVRQGREIHNYCQRATLLLDRDALKDAIVIQKNLPIPVSLRVLEDKDPGSTSISKLKEVLNEDIQ